MTVREMGEAFDLDRVPRFGSLPPVASMDDEEASDALSAYAQTYLREEIQAESLVRNLGGFGRFLDVAAAQNGDLVNYTAIARDAGIAARSVPEYYQILKDTLIGVRLEA